MLTQSGIFQTAASQQMQSESFKKMQKLKYFSAQLQKFYSIKQWSSDSFLSSQVLYTLRTVNDVNFIFSSFGTMCIGTGLRQQAEWTWKRFSQSY